jgi:hypothetical protein
VRSVSNGQGGCLRFLTSLMQWPTDEHRAPDAETLLGFLNLHPEFAASQTSRERCFHACRLLRGETTQPVPYRITGLVLGVTSGTRVKNHAKFAQKQSEIGQVGRPSILSRDEYEEVVAKIVGAYGAKRPVTISHVCELIRNRWRKEMIPDTFYHIARRDPRIRPCTAVPMENTRLDVTPADIDAHLQYLKDTIDRVVAHFVFNMAETRSKRSILYPRHTRRGP